MRQLKSLKNIRGGNPSETKFVFSHVSGDSFITFKNSYIYKKTDDTDDTETLQYYFPETIRHDNFTVPSQEFVGKFKLNNKPVLNQNLNMNDYTEINLAWDKKLPAPTFFTVIREGDIIKTIKSSKEYLSKEKESVEKETSVNLNLAKVQDREKLTLPDKPKTILLEIIQRFYDQIEKLRYVQIKTERQDLMKYITTLIETINHTNNDNIISDFKVSDLKKNLDTFHSKIIDSSVTQERKDFFLLSEDILFSTLYAWLGNPEERPQLITSSLYKEKLKEKVVQKIIESGLTVFFFFASEKPETPSKDLEEELAMFEDEKKGKLPEMSSNFSEFKKMLFAEIDLTQITAYQAIIPDGYIGCSDKNIESVDKFEDFLCLALGNQVYNDWIKNHDLKSKLSTLIKTIGIKFDNNFYPENEKFPSMKNMTEPEMKILIKSIKDVIYYYIGIKVADDIHFGLLSKNNSFRLSF